jgi:trimeric autotransporter adhesin
MKAFTTKEERTMKELRRLSIALAAMILGWAVAAQAQPAVHGTGTANAIPVWTDSSAIGNAIMSQSGGNINVSGGLTATTLSGNGSGLTNVRASTLGGLSPSAFAQLGLSNTFTMSQTINGNLALSGSINNSLTLQGNLTDSSGDLGANVIGGFGGSSTVPGNSVASGIVGATIAGGGGYDQPYFGNVPNTVGADFATVVGGELNSASGPGATVGGGFGNIASGGDATVAGGGGNTASGAFATVPGGTGNSAGGFSAARQV